MVSIKVSIMVSINVSIMVSIMVSQILTKNSFKTGNGLVISPLLRDFFNKNVQYHTLWSIYCNFAYLP